MTGDGTQEGRDFDETWGTETREHDAHNYEPIPPSVFEAGVLATEVNPPGFTFVDLGSGKGRAVLLAARKPWKRVMGVEFRPELHAVAERNLAAFEARDGARCPVELVCADALVHPLPDGPLVLFLYDPFDDPVLPQVLERVGDRAAWLVYVNPQHHRAVESCGFIAVDAEEHPHEPGWSWVVYRSRHTSP